MCSFAVLSLVQMKYYIIWQLRKFLFLSRIDKFIRLRFQKLFTAKESESLSKKVVLSANAPSLYGLKSSLLDRIPDEITDFGIGCNYVGLAWARKLKLSLQTVNLFSKRRRHIRERIGSPKEKITSVYGLNAKPLGKSLKYYLIKVSQCVQSSQT